MRRGVGGLLASGVGDSCVRAFGLTVPSTAEAGDSSSSCDRGSPQDDFRCGGAQL